MSMNNFFLEKVRIAELLIQKGADVNARNELDHNCTEFHDLVYIFHYGGNLK